MDQKIFIFCFIVSSIQLVYCLNKLIGTKGAVYVYDEENDVLGEGASGKVIAGLKVIRDRYEPVALKFLLRSDSNNDTTTDESRSTKDSADIDTYSVSDSQKTTTTAYEETLEQEKRFYDVLNGNTYIPIFHDFLKFNDTEVLIIKLMGFSMSSVLKKCDDKFSIKTTMMLAYQLVKVFQYLHSKRVIHGDLKPDNLGVGFYNQSNIYILDYDLCQFYMDETGKHVQRSKKKYEFGRGTVKYASVHAHRYCILSRRDDIETLGYVLIRCLEGRLPWDKVDSKQDVYEMKKHVSNFKKNVSDVSRRTFIEFIRHARKLTFSGEPDYKYLKKLVVKELKRSDCTHIDLNYDWVNRIKKKELRIERWMKKNIIGKRTELTYQAAVAKKVDEIKRRRMMDAENEKKITKSSLLSRLKKIK